MPKLLPSLGSFAAKVIAFIGRHPTPILVLPSLWFLARYLPFWKDIDATVQLIASAYDDNLLHFPPLYSFLGRVPFFVIDSILSGHAPGIFERQHPSLAAVYGLVVLQHAGLWLALRYFVFSFPARDIARGCITLLLASIASFYAFAHTCGSEAMTPVAYFLVLGAGIRVLLSRATWISWVIYTAALFLAAGSRHVNLILLIWLPGTVVLLWLWSFQASQLGRRLVPRSQRSRVESPDLSGEVGSLRACPTKLPEFQTAGRSRESETTGRRLAITALISFLCTAAAFGADKIVLGTLCHQFGVIERSSLGSAMSGRIGTWVDKLSPERKRALLDSVQRLANDPLVKLAIQFQIEIGSYDKGTGAALADALQARGFAGEKLLALKDQLISQSSFCFYRTLDFGLIKEIFSDFWHGFLPTNDQGIAIAAPKAAFFSLERINQNPSDWEGIKESRIFVPSIAKATLERATTDNMLRHWRWLPILVWTLVFLGFGSWRAARGLLPGRYLFVGLTILGIGTLVYAANCVCIYTLPRYALPLLVTVIAFGCLVSAGSSADKST